MLPPAPPCIGREFELYKIKMVLRQAQNDMIKCRRTEYIIKQIASARTNQDPHDDL